MILSMDYSYVRIGSLPKSRNLLQGVDLDDLPQPLQRALALLKNNDQIKVPVDKLSANQIASVFQANDRFLQDNLGWTATDLIQDLNGFFQFGPPQKQMV
jgi:hypothetical protein